MNEDEKLVNDTSKELYRRVGDDSIFSLPWVPRVVLMVVLAQGDTDNGGFGCFFEADYTDVPPYSDFADAFRAIGADVTANLIETAVALFPFPQPHLNGDARRDYLRTHCILPDGRTNGSAELLKLGDRAIDEGKRNYALLARYIRDHLDEIRGA